MSAWVQTVCARYIGPRVAEEPVEGRLTDLETDRVDGVWERENAADLAVWSGADVGGEVGN